MTLEELKKDVDFAVEHCNNPNGIEVVITLANPSIGGRQSSGIRYVGLGIDWEHGQFRIEPVEKLRREGRTLDDALNTFAIEYIYDKKRQVVYHCPNCENTVKKDEHYCSRCGQHIQVNQEISWSYDYRTNKT